MSTETRNQGTLTAPWYSSNGTQNEVWLAAAAFHEAATVMFEREIQAHDSFWGVQKWHVVHHLSFIACELFMKSLDKIEEHALTHPNGWYEETAVKTRGGHHLWHKKLNSDVAEELIRHLSPEQLALLKETNGNAEIARGRYPYEAGKSSGARNSEKIKRTPVAQDALAFLELAGALKAFIPPLA